MSINPLQFKVKEGNVIGLTMNVDVNYGEMGISHQVELWDELPDGYKDRAQSIYDALWNLALNSFLE